mmetsp:Transcript_23612/g.46187  ORF Transcript_23612/g.46187 Transcript_23612/m.46187 type:complete len:350 (+) Transcript_23612:100-1149(+)
MGVREAARQEFLHTVLPCVRLQAVQGQANRVRALHLGVEQLLQPNVGRGSTHQERGDDARVGAEARRGEAVPSARVEDPGQVDGRLQHGLPHVRPGQLGHHGEERGGEDDHRGHGRDAQREAAQRHHEQVRPEEPTDEARLARRSPERRPPSRIPWAVHSRPVSRRSRDHPQDHAHSPGEQADRRLGRRAGPALLRGQEHDLRLLRAVRRPKPLPARGMLAEPALPQLRHVLPRPAAQHARARDAKHSRPGEGRVLHDDPGLPPTRHLPVQVHAALEAVPHRVRVPHAQEPQPGRAGARVDEGPWAAALRRLPIVQLQADWPALSGRSMGSLGVPRPEGPHAQRHLRLH